MTRPNDYHLPLTGAEYLRMEQWAFNYRTATGGPMRIPPRLYSDLKAAGVSMKDMEPDPTLPEDGPPTQERPS